MNYAETATAQDQAWQAGRIALVPDAWAGRLARKHAGAVNAARTIPAGTGRQAEAIRAANIWLTETTERIGAIRVPVDISDADLCELAERLARECLDLAGGVWLKTPEGIRARLARFVAGYGIAPPALPYTTKAGKRAGIEDGPAIARMTEGQWWRRALRRHQARELERAAIGLGYVRKGGEIYASDATVDRRQQQRRRNAAALETTQAVNKDTGEVFDLAALAAVSVANPRIRRGELMMRLAGFDRVAADLGHVAEFVTLTCPAEFHPYKASGKENPAYAGKTPREAQQWLGKAWAKCRAKLARMGARLYGFRVAEPHKTGTPHWHAVFFMREFLSAGRRLVPRVRAIIRRYFLGLWPDKDRKAHGVKFMAIDRAKHEGGAAGYLAKYISKNIDGGGYQVQLTLEGGATVDPSARVEAWASTWGIRQFQQIGGPPVGVWREARRLEEGGDYSERVEAIRQAADVGQKTEGQRGAAAAAWAVFVGLMGGPQVERRNLPARVAYTPDGGRWDYHGQAPYPAPLTRYGETARGVVFGVRDEVAGLDYPGRRYRWEIKRGAGNGASSGKAGVRAADAENAAGISVCAGGDQGELAGGAHRGQGLAGVDLLVLGPKAPWTRVNNCTCDLGALCQEEGEERGQPRTSAGGAGQTCHTRGPGSQKSGAARPIG